MKKTLLLLVVAMLAMVTIGATIYKWVDEQGVTHYSETPPPSRKAKELPVQPAPPDAGMEGSKPEAKSWQQQEKEFKQRQEAREKTDTQEETRKDVESTERQSNCKKAKDELARLLATKPLVKKRDFVPLRVPETGKAVETMNNAERSAGIERAEEEMEKWCNY